MSEDKQLNKKVQSPFQNDAESAKWFGPAHPTCALLLRTAALLTSPLLLFN